MLSVGDTMRSGGDRKRWRPPMDAEKRRQSIDDAVAAVVDCLVEARGGTYAEQRAYLRDVLARAGATGDPEWPDLYRCLTLLQKDALAEGAEPRLVQEHVTRLHRILEQVE